jgi:hypothetical protein
VDFAHSQTHAAPRAEGRPAAHVGQRRPSAEAVDAQVEHLERRPRPARERREAGVADEHAQARPAPARQERRARSSSSSAGKAAKAAPSACGPPKAACVSFARKWVNAGQAASTSALKLSGLSLKSLTSRRRRRASRGSAASAGAGAAVLKSLKEMFSSSSGQGALATASTAAVSRRHHVKLRRRMEKAGAAASAAIAAAAQAARAAQVELLEPPAGGGQLARHLRRDGARDAERAQPWRCLGARGAEQLVCCRVRQRRAQLELAQRGHALQRRRDGARGGRVHGNFAKTEAERVQAAPGLGPERLEGRLVGVEKVQLLEPRPARRRRRPRGGGALAPGLHIRPQLGRLADRVPQLGVRSASRSSAFFSAAATSAAAAGACVSVSRSVCASATARRHGSLRERRFEMESQKWHPRRRAKELTVVARLRRGSRRSSMGQLAGPPTL